MDLLAAKLEQDAAAGEAEAGEGEQGPAEERAMRAVVGEVRDHIEREESGGENEQIAQLEGKAEDEAAECEPA